jgi:hypothetical protein
VLHFVGKYDVQIPVRQVIGAYYSEPCLEVYFLSKKKSKGYLNLSKVEGTVEDTAAATAWSKILMNGAYQGM